MVKVGELMGLRLGVIFCTTMVVLTLSGCVRNEKKLSREDSQHNNKNVILNKESVNEFSMGDLTKDYKIIDIIRKEKDLIVHVETELNNSKEAFEMGSFISESMKLTNEEKLKIDNVEKIKVFFNGMKKDFYFDGTNEIKEINQNWGE